MKKAIIAAIVLMALVANALPGAISDAQAAQGQITEVNPSGIHGTITVVEGELIGQIFHLVSSPDKGRPSPITFEVGDIVTFEPFHKLAIGATKSVGAGTK